MVWASTNMHVQGHTHTHTLCVYTNRTGILLLNDHNYHRLNKYTIKAEDHVRNLYLTLNTKLKIDVFFR